MDRDEGVRLSKAARRLERHLTDEEPTGDSASEAGFLATVAERFGSGVCKLSPLDADALLASRIRITLATARAPGVPVSFEISTWGRAAHLLELAAYCQE